MAVKIADESRGFSKKKLVGNLFPARMVELTRRGCFNADDHRTIEDNIKFLERVHRGIIRKETRNYNGVWGPEINALMIMQEIMQDWRTKENVELRFTVRNYLNALELIKEREMVSVEIGGELEAIYQAMDTYAGAEYISSF